MSHFSVRSFRPRLESVEDRCLAAVHPVESAIGFNSSVSRIRPVADHRATAELQLETQRLPRRVNPPMRFGWSRPPAVLARGGGAPAPGQGTLPANFRNWGVITLWNTTTQPITFSVSASTFQDGRYFNFMLRPGQFQSYFATYDDFNNAPAFRITFDPIERTNPLLIANINTVFERSNWYPGRGTEGRPYAIAVNVSGLYLASI